MTPHSPKAFAKFFDSVAGSTPWAWQAALANSETCTDRVLRIPTGFGKTAGTVLTWLHHRVVRADKRWPTRLIFCLPMRVLVEQTLSTIKTWLATAGLSEDVDVHALMGGADAGPWLTRPDRPAILVGTQDMLLSRALMRGYGSSRGKWPMEFALLNNDALWVLDEVQLMGPSLSTSTQLAAFRQSRGARPVFHWWMSATLQPRWLHSVDFAPAADRLAKDLLEIPKSERKTGLFKVKRTLEHGKNIDSDSVAAFALLRHEPGTLTLIIVNRVERAVSIAEALRKPPKVKKGEAAPPALDVRLVHSRFRGHERGKWPATFLARKPAEPIPEAGRIIVATQVVEAGVDISARLLITELAPWSSLIQRFGRCARYEGETGTVVVIGKPPATEKDATPYELAELTHAARAVGELGDDAGPGALAEFEEELSDERLRDLYPYEPRHVLREKDVLDLFDTSADLAGADLDVGRFIRPDNDRDISVFWRDVDPTRKAIDADFPTRPELCPVPLFGDRGFEKQLKERMHWTYDYLDQEWKRSSRRPPPGAVVMLSSTEGGYGESGWDPKEKAGVVPVPAPPDPRREQLEKAASGQGNDALSQAHWQSIADHGRDVGSEVKKLAAALAVSPNEQKLLELAGRWHDAGKAHEVFQDAIGPDARAATGRPEQRDWAKAPRDAWTKKYERRGFRHELVSTLMLMEALHRVDPFHLASAGGVREVLAALGQQPPPPGEPITGPLGDELKTLNSEEFDLVAYLVCAHHGKVRCQWSPSPLDREAERRVLGVDDGDVVKAVSLATSEGSQPLGPLTLHLDAASLGASPRYGASWSERVEALLGLHGPFRLAFLETLLRCADWTASANLEPKS